MSTCMRWTCRLTLSLRSMPVKTKDDKMVGVGGARQSIGPEAMSAGSHYLLDSMFWTAVEL